MSSSRPYLFTGEMVRAMLREIERPGSGKTQIREVLKPQPVFSPQGDGGAWSNSVWIWKTHEWGGNTADVRPMVDSLKYQVGDVLWARETFAVEGNYMTGDMSLPFDDGRPVRWVDDGLDGDVFWEQCHYRATDPAPELCCESEKCAQCRDDHFGSHWQPSSRMPRWASRIECQVTDVRIERVQEISEADARAEGTPACRTCRGVATSPINRAYCPDCSSWRGEFAKLWDSINAKPKAVYTRVDGKRQVSHYVSYPWEDVQEVREHNDLPWHVHGNPWVVAYTFDPSLREG